MRTRLFSLILGAGGVLCAAAVAWYFAVAPVWRERLPAGWRWTSNFVGITTYADADGTYPAEDVSAEYERSMFVADESGRPGSLQLMHRITNRDFETGEVTWQSTIPTAVDPRSGAYLGEGYEGGISVFPHHTEPRTYRLYLGYLKDIPISFEREEDVGGITTYLFHYKGRVEYTESYLATEEYEGLEVEPGQEIRCNDDQFVLNIWVEPTTGEIVTIEESCYSGDSVYDVATGRKMYEIARWGGISRGDESMTRAAALRWKRLELLAMTRYVPGLLLILGVAALVMGAWLQRNRGGMHSGN